MGTHRLSFFMTVPEFASFMESINDALDTEIRDSSFVVWSPSRGGRRRTPMVLAPRGAKMPKERPISAREGWIDLTPPDATKDRLYLAEIATKDRWWDVETEQAH